jgi:hypothetical protein
VVDLWTVNNPIARDYWQQQGVLVTTDVCHPSPIALPRPAATESKVSAAM